MDRRDFSKVVGAGALYASVGGRIGDASAASTSAPATKSQTPGKVDRKHRKEWAKEHFKGFENVLMPSFSLDLKTLDEEGIRLDVRKSIEHGFFSTMVAGVSTTLEENKRFIDIAVDEAKGSQMSVAISASRSGNEAESMKLIQHAEKVGVQHFLLNLPNEGSQEDLYKYGLKYSEATNMGIYLWMATPHNFKRFSPAKIPYETFDKLADLPNIVALKVGDPDAATLFEVFERYNSRMLIGALWLPIMPMAIRLYGMQWSGAWTVEALQSPEKPYATDFFRLMSAGKYDEGMKLYWRYLVPGFGAMMARAGPLMASGGKPWEHLKLNQFATGGNGGRMRPDPKFPNLPPVTAQDIKGFKNLLRTIDIKPDDAPDEAFYVGRTAYAKGVRQKI